MDGLDFSASFWSEVKSRKAGVKLENNRWDDRKLTKFSGRTEEGCLHGWNASDDLFSIIWLHNWLDFFVTQRLRSFCTACLLHRVSITLSVITSRRDRTETSPVIPFTVLSHSRDHLLEFLLRNVLTNIGRSNFLRFKWRSRVVPNILTVAIYLEFEITWNICGTYKILHPTPEQWILREPFSSSLDCVGKELWSWSNCRKKFFLRSKLRQKLKWNWIYFLCTFFVFHLLMDLFTSYESNVPSLVDLQVEHRKPNPLARDPSSE